MIKCEDTVLYIKQTFYLRKAFLIRTFFFLFKYFSLQRGQTISTFIKCVKCFRTLINFHVSGTIANQLLRV